MRVPEQHEPSDLPPAYIITGDALRQIPLDVLYTKLAQIVGLDADLVIAPAIHPLAERAGAMAVPATRSTFIEFAEEHAHHSSQRALKSWISVFYTGPVIDDKYRRDTYDPFPPVRWVARSNHPNFSIAHKESIVDLRSIEERLRASGLQPGAWASGTSSHVTFLVHMVNELLQPEDPLSLQ